MVRFDDIDPGADGAITLTMTWNGTAGNEGKGTYSNAITITETDPPPP